ncbi:hypothetical protein RFI_04908 [Reticulomyxa filosa]|uniref:Uncharacterized protein n=1 Tax=Reticulomyxa filosa TaxID=46433 RepID=X6P2A5_RETFI|nr:hypothetical protein RFI_04908 [Reticulomyxa filosa]|eukprot:ETO32204.1 hypothetical protein RFI_04908 [Reticulomyxa filosa]
MIFLYFFIFFQLKKKSLFVCNLFIYLFIFLNILNFDLFETAVTSFAKKKKGLYIYLYVCVYYKNMAWFVVFINRHAPINEYIFFFATSLHKKKLFSLDEKFEYKLELGSLSQGKNFGINDMKLGKNFEKNWEKNVSEKNVREKTLVKKSYGKKHWEKSIGEKNIGKINICEKLLKMLGKKHVKSILWEKIKILEKGLGKNI